MSRLLFATAFLLGAAAVAWMGSSFLGVSSLGFGVVAVIGVVYAIGFIELLQFRQATTTLSQALAATAVPADGKITVLDEWLKTLHVSLRNAVRLRIEGERVALPNPVLTPYLVSLLVMLGLLGTFAGMVDTLKGAVIALEGSTQLEAIRAGLTAPIGGLSLAFGTSVAGVAASAMLGLMSTLSRRDRMLSARLLDSHILGVFREFSLTHQRQETYKALQIQSQGLPEATEKLHALASQMARMSEHIEAKLLANQEHFHASATTSYQQLAASVGQSLRESLAESGRLAGESLKPIMQQAMTAISAEVSTATRTTCEQLTHSAQTTYEQLTHSAQVASEQLTQTAQVTCEQVTRTAQMTYEYLTNTTQTTYAHLTHTTQKQLEQLTHTAQTQLQAFNAQFQHSSTAVVSAMAVELRQVTANQQTSIQQLTERFEQLANTLLTEFSSLRETEERRGAAAVERLAELEAGVAAHLATLGKALEDPMTRLIQTASEAPRAAAEVISQLRSEVSKNIERDNQLLEERLQTMAELHTLSESLESGLGRLAGMTELMAGSTTDMASLGEAFSLAVNLYSESNQKLIDSLDRIEGSLVNSTIRSDEQLGYYVAQAREVIDHSILSQKEIFEEIRHLGQKSMAEAIN